MIKKRLQNYLAGKSTSSFVWRKLTGARYLRNKSIRNLLKRNKELKDKYKGKRCFILGNGPSLNTIDFSLLRDEYVFTVNMLMEHEKFNDLNSNFHVVVDAEVFRASANSGLEDDYYLKKLSKLFDNHERILFVPADAEGIIKEAKIDQKIQTRYLQSFNYYNEIGTIELAETIPAFNKVIQYAIVIAVYLGFSQIYLLGCEETNVLPYINLLMEGNTRNDHCYEDSDKSKESWIRRLREKGMSWLFEDQALVFKRYELLSKFCDKQGIELINLTQKSIIDCIKKDTIENVLGG